jgi:hypothetical protein
MDIDDSPLLPLAPSGCTHGYTESDLNEEDTDYDEYAGYDDVVRIRNGAAT